MRQKCMWDKNWRLCPSWKCSQQSVNNHLAKHNTTSLSNYWNYTLCASLFFKCKASPVCRSVVSTPLKTPTKPKQWKHITGFPKYMTVNLKTRLPSCIPQNMTHSTDTFSNNDVNTIIYRVVCVCVSVWVCFQASISAEKNWLSVLCSRLELVAFQICLSTCERDASLWRVQLQNHISTIFKKAAYNVSKQPTKWWLTWN